MSGLRDKRLPGGGARAMSPWMPVSSAYKPDPRFAALGAEFADPLLHDAFSHVPAGSSANTSPSAPIDAHGRQSASPTITRKPVQKRIRRRMICLARRPEQR